MVSDSIDGPMVPVVMSAVINSALNPDVDVLVLFGIRLQEASYAQCHQSFLFRHKL